MSKIFIKILLMEGGVTNLIFLAELKVLALSEGGCFNSCSRAAASFSASKSAFSCSALIVIHTFLVLLLILIQAILELPLTQRVLNLELLSRHHKIFELLHTPIAVLPTLIAVLHAQILTSILRSFRSWLFFYLID